MSVIGLTGGVGSGKSLVTDYLISRGIAVIDADLLAHEVVRVGEPAYKEIVDEFGIEMLHDDGTLNRKRLGDLVFCDEERRKKLESIIHPRVYEKAWEAIGRLQKENDHALIVFSVPLLFETGHDKDVDKVIVVYADEEVMIERLIKRDGFSLEEAWKRLAAQMPIAKKKSAADFVINNTGIIRETLQQVNELLTKLESSS